MRRVANPRPSAVTIARRPGIRSDQRQNPEDLPNFPRRPAAGTPSRPKPPQGGLRGTPGDHTGDHTGARAGPRPGVEPLGREAERPAGALTDGPVRIPSTALGLPHGAASGARPNEASRALGPATLATDPSRYQARDSARLQCLQLGPPAAQLLPLGLEAGQQEGGVVAQADALLVAREALARAVLGDHAQVHVVVVDVAVVHDVGRVAQVEGRVEREDRAQRHPAQAARDVVEAAERSIQRSKTPLCPMLASSPTASRPEVRRSPTTSSACAGASVPSRVAQGGRLALEFADRRGTRARPAVSLR